MSSDGKNCTSRWIHRDYFIREYLFSTWKRNLKVDISSFLYIYSSCLWGKYSLRFRLFLFTCLWRKLTETVWDGRERSLFVFFILQKHIVLLLLWLYTKKVDPLQFQTMSYSYPYDQKWQYFFVIFTVIKKKHDKRTGAVFDPGGLKFMEPFHYTKVSL